MLSKFVSEIMNETFECIEYKDESVPDDVIKDLIKVALEFSNVSEIKDLRIKVLERQDLKTIESYDSDIVKALGSAPIGINFYVPSYPKLDKVLFDIGLAIGSVYERVNCTAIAHGYATTLILRPCISHTDKGCTYKLIATVLIGVASIKPVRKHVGDVEEYMLD